MTRWAEAPEQRDQMVLFARFVISGTGTCTVRSKVLAAGGLMMRAGVMHPPAGSNPLIVMLLQPGWLFAFTPTLIGALLLVLLGLLLINLQKDKHYPKHW